MMKEQLRDSRVNSSIHAEKLFPAIEIEYARLRRGMQRNLNLPSRYVKKVDCLFYRDAFLTADNAMFCEDQNRFLDAGIEFEKLAKLLRILNHSTELIIKAHQRAAENYSKAADAMLERYGAAEPSRARLDAVMNILELELRNRIAAFYSSWNSTAELE
ncbi:MAG: hypothetical protein ABR981_00270 [Candidatus Micrarchaeaceae archaeon]|jgi:hypothetical protein